MLIMHKDWQNVKSQVIPYTDRDMDQRGFLSTLEKILVISNNIEYACTLKIFTFLDIHYYEMFICIHHIQKCS